MKRIGEPLRGAFVQARAERNLGEAQIARRFSKSFQHAKPLFQGADEQRSRLILFAAAAESWF